VDRTYKNGTELKKVGNRDRTHQAWHMRRKHTHSRVQHESTLYSYPIASHVNAHTYSHTHTCKAWGNTHTLRRDTHTRNGIRQTMQVHPHKQVRICVCVFVFMTTCEAVCQCVLSKPSVIASMQEGVCA